MESKHSTVITIVKGLGTGSILAVLMIASMRLMQGCSINLPSVFGKKTMDSMSTAIDGCVDPAKIEYLGRREDTGKTGYNVQYNYLVTDIKADNEDDLQKMFDAANDVFESGEYDSSRVQISFICEHFQSDVYYTVASFRNYDDDGRICSYICEIDVYGIDRMAKDYDSNYSYQFNDTDFWDQFAGDATIIYTKYIEYVNSIEDDKAERDLVEDYLLSEYGDYITFGGISVSNDSNHSPELTWEITIDADSIESSSEYDSVTALVEAVRHSLNDYYHSLDGGSKVLDMRNTFSCTLSGTSKTWSFTNYYNSTGEYLDGYGYVNYWNATVEELCALEDVTAINFYNKDEDVVTQVLDSVDGLENVYCTLDSEVEAELASKYPDIAID
ncbi:MAG: hypothetical protein J5776_04420 [Clostridiales bacterium]|nr:hypothetical protein [Clostridiales bacterium]